MTSLGRHGRNVLWLLLVQVVGKVFGFIYFAYLFNKLTLEQNEWYALFVSILPMLMVLNTMGFHDVVNREVARDRSRVHGLMSSAIVAETALFAPIALLMTLWAVLRPMALPLRHVLILTPFVAFVAALLEIHNAIFAAHERFKYPSIVNIAARLATVCGGIVLLYIGLRVRALAIFLGSVQVVQLALYWLLFRAYCGGYRFSPNLRDIRFLFRQGFTMAAGRFGEQTYYRMDLPALRLLGAPGLSVVYALGPRFLNLLSTAPDVLESVFYPVVSRKSKEGPEAEVFVLERFLKVAFLAGAPMAAGMTVLHTQVVRQVAGEAYVVGSPVAVVFAWLVGLALLDRVVVVYLRSSARQHLLMSIYGAVLFAKCAACLALLPAWGIEGLLVVNLTLSALMTVTMFVTMALTNSAFAPRRMSALAWRPVAASCLMAAALWPFRGAAIWWTIPAGAAVYLAALLMLGTFDELDRRLVRGALGL